MKKLLFTGLLASSALFLLGGCGSSNTSDASSSVANSSEKTSDGRKILISGPFGGRAHEKKPSKKSLRISTNHKTRSM